MRFRDQMTVTLQQPTLHVPVVRAVMPAKGVMDAVSDDDLQNMEDGIGRFAEGDVATVPGDGAYWIHSFGRDQAVRGESGVRYRFQYAESCIQVDERSPARSVEHLKSSL
ncbi:MAG: hypothetical protein DI564_05895 [Rhodanobacter denitrificans]|uniref:Uncharacterized protein n=1 Tax=Rhodanobacter denitrificans TaxID=666685 RepID=A0A2W5KK00_9GAMM|nr:MAG: hypothetical protein DI564_05895 [Rhodanobacter denitrificans]